MVLRSILGNTANPAVKTERIKLLAGGCQLIAVATLVSSIVSPLFNPALDSTLKTHITGGLSFRPFRTYGDARPRLSSRRQGGLTMWNFFQGVIVAGRIGFGLVALGLYIEQRWIGLPRNR